MTQAEINELFEKIEASGFSNSDGNVGFAKPELYYEVRASIVCSQDSYFNRNSGLKKLVDEIGPEATADNYYRLVGVMRIIKKQIDDWYKSKEKEAR